MDNAPVSSQPLIVSTMVDMYEGKGHIYDYNCSVGDAARLLGWSHRAALPTGDWKDRLPEGWNACLAGGDLKLYNRPVGEMHRRLVCGHQLSHSLSAYLKEQVLPQPSPTVLFLEYVTHPLQLLAFAMALRRVSVERLWVWLLFRYSLSPKSSRGQTYKLITRLIERTLPPGHLLLLSDSDLLSRSLAQHFCRPVHPMPIPHLETLPQELPPVAQRVPSADRPVVCWWPGFPREEKGWPIMRFLAQRTDDAAAQLTLVAAEAAALTPHTGRCQVQALDNSLPRWRYVQQFTASDVIVLPYDPPRYAESTSGIFVESIVFGTMPIVTANTWMAYELSKYQLTDLVLSLDEWRQPDIAARLLSCARQPQLWQRLETMRQHYLHQHGEQAYAAAMLQMWAISNGQRDTAAVQSQEGAQ